MTNLSKQEIFPGALSDVYKSNLEKAGRINVVRQIIAKNPVVFRKKSEADQKLILNRLGWIDVVRRMPAEIGRMQRLADQVKKDGIRHVFVLGMGGSSLCPEVFGRIFGRQKWLKSYMVVDTTAPSQLESILNSVDLGKSFFIVSSKSGSTVETMSQFRFFFRKVKEFRPLKVGDFFAAITDEGSELHRIARRNRFRDVFLNPKDIGGRYSALSYFGLVPGAFTNADLNGLLAAAAGQLAVMEDKGDDCDALKLGVLLGSGAKGNYDRVRFVATEGVAPFVPWIEQLLAESTGKESKGIIPIEGDLDHHAGADNIFHVFYSMSGEKIRPGASPASVKDSVAPYVTIETADPTALGAEMLKWEMATAVAATILGVNPFDEPNVAESKKNTAAILHSKRGPRKEILVTPVAAFDGVDVLAAMDVRGLERRRRLTSEELFRAFFKDVGKGEYVSILCYTEMDPAVEKRLIKLRNVLGEKYGIVSLRGYGPRFLHSTGQLFKGGSPKGHFIVIDRNYRTDYDIPTTNLSFGRLIKAQAQGDIKALQKRRRPVIHLNLKYDPVGGLDRLIALISSL